MWAETTQKNAMWLATWRATASSDTSTSHRPVSGMTKSSA